MIDELEALRLRRSAEAAIGLSTGDHVYIPADQAAALGPEVPADAPRVDYMVAVVDGDTFKLRTPSEASPAEPEHHPGARRPGHKSVPPVPRWAKRRGWR